MKKKIYAVIYVVLCVFVLTLSLFPPVVNLIGSFLSEDFVEVVFSSTLEKAVSEYVGFKHAFSLSQYIDVLVASPDYLYRFWNSIFIVAPVVVFQLVFSSLTAYGLARGKGRFFTITLYVFLVLMMLPKQVTVIPNYYAVKRLNMLNTWMAVWLPGVLSSFCVYLLTRYMKRIPEGLFDAAKIDGAGDGRLFVNMVLPICRGEIIALGTLILVDSWNQVELPLIMFNKSTMYPLSVYLSTIRENAVGISFASSIIYMIPVLLLFLLSPWIMAIIRLPIWKDILSKFEMQIGRAHV